MPDANSSKFHNRVAYRIEHTPDLLVFALTQDDFVPRVAGFFGSIHQSNFSRSRARASERYASSQSIDLISSRHSLDLDVIHFFDATSSGDRIGKVTVVGENYQPFGVEIESPHWMKPSSS